MKEDKITQTFLLNIRVNFFFYILCYNNYINLFGSLIFNNSSLIIKSYKKLSKKSWRCILKESITITIAKM